MTREINRLPILLPLFLALAVLAAGVSLAPAPAQATSTPSAVVAQAGHAEVIPVPTVSYYLPKVYRAGYRRALRHYQDLQARPATTARLDWWTPSVPDWIEEAAEKVIEPFEEAKWWLVRGFKCGAAVASIWVAGGGKIATIALKIAKLSKADRNVRKARRAIRRLGGIREAMSLLGTYAKTRGGGVTSTEKALLGIVVKSGGAVIANLLGVTSCVDMVKRIV